MGDGAVLIAAGTTMEGTAAGAELAFDKSKLAGILHGCGADIANPNVRFEILMGLNVTAGSRESSEVLATRCSAGKPSN